MLPKTKTKTSQPKASQPKARAAAKRRPARATPAPDQRKRQILRAAVEVFAERGYHGCRISDVADRAGVAYGLVYHYFGNKEGLLETIFQHNWAVFGKALEDIAEQDASCQERIRQIVGFLLNAYELNPMIVKVIVLEFGRNYRVGDALDSPEVARVFSALRGIFEEAAKTGELQPGADPHAVAIILLGSLEAALASFILPSPTGSGTQKMQDFEAMRSTLLSIVSHGFLRAPPSEGGSAPTEAAKSKPAKSKPAKSKPAKSKPAGTKAKVAAAKKNPAGKKRGA